jgi:hypothetical protein
MANISILFQITPRLFYFTQEHFRHFFKEAIIYETTRA